MKQPRMTPAHVKRLIVGLFLTQWAFAQGYDDPLKIQGLDQSTPQPAASRAAGGTTVGVLNDVGIMFTNPAALQTLEGIQLSFGGIQQSTKSTQVQQYAPLKYYSNFSLLMEGLTGVIPNPDTVRAATSAGDSVQRPFDTIGPNWSRSKSRTSPVQAMLGVPFSIGDNKFVAGIGVVQYAGMNHYYQNNNVLSPAIGSDRPFPVALPPSDSTPVRTNWSSYLRLREGSIQGYGAALSGSLSDRISLGISGIILKGSTDDLEQRIGRGRLTFYKQWFRLDSVYHRVVQSGTSEYSGTEITFGGTYRGRYVSIGIVLKPPATITRTYTAQVRNDTTGLSAVKTVSGEDAVRLPWRGTIGLSIAVLEDLRLGLEYEIHSYASAVYTKPDGTESRPWLSSAVLHVGAEYRPSPWLALRAGMRGQAEVFEQTGNPIPGEPVSYLIYSAGCGVTFGGIRLNVTYEYSSMKYQDMWQTNVNLNDETRHGVIADVSYSIPALWQE
jgi:opacity protein-like surface antigen